MQRNGCTLNGEVVVYLLVSFSVVCLLWSHQMFPLLCGQSQADRVVYDWSLTLNTFPKSMCVLCCHLAANFVTNKPKDGAATCWILS